MVSTGQITLFREHDQNGPALYFIVIFMVNGILEKASLASLSLGSLIVEVLLPVSPQKT